MGDMVDDVVPLPSTQAAARHLGALGFDVVPTRPDAGEGFHLRGDDLVAVVGEPGVPLAQLQRLAGIAAVEGLSAAAVAAEPFGEDAADWAERAGIALFTLAPDGGVGAANDVAHRWTARGRSEEPALRRAAVDGDLAAMTELGRLLLRDGRRTEATLWYRRAVDAGAEGAWQECADLLAEAGATAQLWSWCRDLAGRGDPAAMLRLADLHAAAGEPDAELNWLGRYVDAGRSDRALRLGELHEAAGRVDAALRAYTIAADAGETPAARHVARLLRDTDPGK